MTFDPGISEWGNPPCRDARYPLMWGHTRGTETSKYPQEEKITNDSPSSGERTGRSPNWRPQGASGVVGPRHRRSMRSGTAWEGRRHRVKAPYAYSCHPQRDPE